MGNFFFVILIIVVQIAASVLTRMSRRAAEETRRKYKPTIYEPARPVIGPEQPPAPQLEAYEDDTSQPLPGEYVGSLGGGDEDEGVSAESVESEVPLEPAGVKSAPGMGGRLVREALTRNLSTRPVRRLVDILAESNARDRGTEVPDAASGTAGFDGLDFSPANVMQGIVMSEVLGRPKSLLAPRRRAQVQQR